MNYKELAEFLGDKEHKLIKKSKAQTGARRKGDDIAIWLYETDILTFKPDGTIILDSGGWKTNTTKARLNDYLPKEFFVYQKNSAWYLFQAPSYDYIFEDGLTIHPDGTITGCGDANSYVQLKKQVDKYVKGFMTELMAGRIGRPGPGDCWDCYMEDVETGKPMGDLSKSDHILLHLEEQYYVPSLLVRAVEEFPVGMIVRWWLSELMNGQEIKGGEDITRHQVSSSLKRYLKRKVGLPV